MSDERIIVFDIIGTCFSLNKPRQQLIEFGTPDYALELWFSQALRDAFAFSHAGSYQPLKEILQVELPRTLKTFEIELNSNQLSQVIETLGELELQPMAKEALELLSASNCKIIALTNGSKDSTLKLLKRANARQYFAEVYSCDAIAITKPHPDVYRMIKVDNLENVWLIASHAWDIAGANMVGMKTAFVSQLEKSYLEVYPQPQIVAENLLVAARQILQA